MKYKRTHSTIFKDTSMCNIIPYFRIAFENLNKTFAFTFEVAFLRWTAFVSVYFFKNKVNQLNSNYLYLFFLIYSLK